MEYYIIRISDGEILHTCESLQAAEAFIAGPLFDKDPVGVENGEYYVDWKE